MASPNDQDTIVKFQPETRCLCAGLADTKNAEMIRIARLMADSMAWLMHNPRHLRLHVLRWHLAYTVVSHRTYRVVPRTASVHELVHFSIDYRLHSGGTEGLTDWGAETEETVSGGQSSLSRRVVLSIMIRSVVYWDAPCQSHHFSTEYIFGDDTKGGQV